MNDAVWRAQYMNDPEKEKMTMPNTTLDFMELMDAIEDLDPKWKLNPPRPGTEAWFQLSKEDVLELLPRYARKLRIRAEDIDKLGDKEIVYGPTRLFGGIQVIESEVMPNGIAALFDQNDNLLICIKLK